MSSTGAKKRGDLPQIALCAALFVATATVGGVLAPRAQSEVEMPRTGLTRAQHTRLEEVASASLFGQFRSNMADFLYLKVDKYLHNGVELRALTPYEEEVEHADKVGVAESDIREGFKQHGHDETTVVPSKQSDWRGILGDLEREVQPYQDMSAHTHRDPKEALPLFRLMTWSNPNFIPGYTLGAMMIARDRSKVDDAIAFLKEGEANNPQALEIKTELGHFLTGRKRDFEAAVPYLREAIAIGKQRDPKTMTEDEAEAFQNAYRWLVLNRREAGQPAEARAAAEECVARYPNDVVCRHYLAESSKP